MLPACKNRVVKDRYCHTFPTGDMECRDQNVKRSFRINKIKCDQQRPRPFCFKIPVLDCRLGQNSNCKMVPRRVCNQRCNNSPQCNTCSNFIQQGPGFGSCPSSTCGSFYPDLSNGTGPLGGGAGVDGYFPGGGEGTGEGGIYAGSGGYFPAGGSGSYQSGSGSYSGEWINPFAVYTVTPL